jgi:hypothetical protein
LNRGGEAESIVPLGLLVPSALKFPAGAACAGEISVTSARPRHQWPQGLGDGRRYLERLAGDVRERIKQGIPMAVAVKTACASESDRWELFDAYNTRNATAAYAELEWE